MDRHCALITMTVDDSMYDAFLVDDTDLFDERGNDACFLRRLTPVPFLLARKGQPWRKFLVSK